MSSGKEEMRKRVKEVRSRLSTEEVAELSARIGLHLRRLMDGESVVMVYASKPGEVDTSGLISWLLSQGTRVVVPIIKQKTRSLRLSYLEDPCVLRPSTFLVPEPVGREIPADASAVNLVIIPLIAFDRQGHRLGYGAGYYDRFLYATSLPLFGPRRVTRAMTPTASAPARTARCAAPRAPRAACRA